MNCIQLQPLLVCRFDRAKADEDDGAKQLANAPSTLMSGDALPDIEGLDLLFKVCCVGCYSLLLLECIRSRKWARKSGYGVFIGTMSF